MIFVDERWKIHWAPLLSWDYAYVAWHHPLSKVQLSPKPALRHWQNFIYVPSMPRPEWSIEYSPTQHHYFLGKLSLLLNTTSFVGLLTIYSPYSMILSIVYAIKIKHFLIGEGVFFPKVMSQSICKFHCFTFFKICESWLNCFLVWTIS